MKISEIECTDKLVRLYQLFPSDNSEGFIVVIRQNKDWRLGCKKQNRYLTAVFPCLGGSTRTGDTSLESAKREALRIVRTYANRRRNRRMISSVLEKLLVVLEENDY